MITQERFSDCCGVESSDGWEESGMCPKCNDHAQYQTIEEYEEGMKPIKKLNEAMTEERNNMWKGDNVGYAALHEWVKSRLIKPKKCQECDLVKSLDLANISQEYKRDLSDWEWLCRKCHMVKDGRLDRLHADKKYLTEKACLHCKEMFMPPNATVECCSKSCAAYISHTKRSGTLMITFEGTTMSASSWAKHIGMPCQTLYSRLKRGVPIGRALITKRISKANDHCTYQTIGEYELSLKA
jgi:hypothetical protein